MTLKGHRMLRNIRASLIVLAVSTSAAVAADVVPVPQIEMPPGIQIYQTRQGPVFATDRGMTIYKKLPKVGSWALAKGQADANGSCAYQCGSEWPAVTAAKDAQPVGDFTIVAGENGVRQWAYKGVPLQTFLFDREPGDTLGEDTHSFNGPRRPWGEAAWIEAENPLIEPPPIPAPTAARPPSVTVQNVYGGNRVFASAEGRTLYARAGSGKDKCDAKCLSGRTPFVAAQFAKPIGEWSVAEDDLGVRLWAYRGKVVYTYSGDREAREVEGEDAAWVAVKEHEAVLPPEVDVALSETGPVYVDKKSGKTLYYQGFAPRHYEYLGFNHPKHLFGTVNCYNACAEEYPPLLAAAGAKPFGEWWLVKRLDGTMQWAHRGVPIYMYAKDEPGRHLASYRDHKWAVLRIQ